MDSQPGNHQMDGQEVEAAAASWVQGTAIEGIHRSIQRRPRMRVYTRTDIRIVLSLCLYVTCRAQLGVNANASAHSHSGSSSSSNTALLTCLHLINRHKAGPNAVCEGDGLGWLQIGPHQKHVLLLHFLRHTPFASAAAMRHSTHQPNPVLTDRVIAVRLAV